MSVAQDVPKTLITRILMLLVLVGAIFGMASSARADPVPVGGLWQEFSWTGPGVFARGCLPNDPLGLGCVPSSGGNSAFAPAPPWTFTFGAGGGNLTVTDAFSIGDSFNIFDFGVLIGTTPSVAQGGNCGDNPVPCLANPLVSHGVFSLLAGAHSITIQTRVAPFGAGAAYFRTDQNQNVVPEPTSMLLLGTGLLGAFGVARRKRKMKR